MSKTSLQMHVNLPYNFNYHIILIESAWHSLIIGDIRRILHLHYILSHSDKTNGLGMLLQRKTQVNTSHFRQNMPTLTQFYAVILVEI